MNLRFNPARTALAAALALTSLHAAASNDLESFDATPIASIPVGESLALTHITVVPVTGTAAINPVLLPTPLASGRALGARPGVSLATMDLVLDKPRARMDLTMAMPAGDASAESTLLVQGRAGTAPYRVGLWHGALSNRVRLSLMRPDGEPIERVTLKLRNGAYIDNVELAAFRRPDDVVLDFNQVQAGTINGRIDAATALVMPMAGAMKVEALADGSQVLTSGDASGNQAMLMFREARSHVEIDVEADPDGGPATIDVLAEGDFAPVHSLPVASTDGRRRIVFERPGGRIQGVQWSGGRVKIAEVVLTDH